MALKRAVAAGEVVGWGDVEIDPNVMAVEARREMEARFTGQRSGK